MVNGQSQGLAKEGGVGRGAEGRMESLLVRRDLPAGDLAELLARRPFKVPALREGEVAHAKGEEVFAVGCDEFC